MLSRLHGIMSELRSDAAAIRCSLLFSAVGLLADDREARLPGMTWRDSAPQLLLMVLGCLGAEDQQVSWRCAHRQRSLLRTHPLAMPCPKPAGVLCFTFTGPSRGVVSTGCPNCLAGPVRPAAAAGGAARNHGAQHAGLLGG
mgnify:CR=1 FL=1